MENTTGSKCLYLHPQNIPDPETVNTFIDQLFETREKYLRETYLKFDPNLRYDNQYHNLKWMLSSDVITKDEFESKYEELKSLYSSERTIKGFSR